VVGSGGRRAKHDARPTVQGARSIFFAEVRGPGCVTPTVKQVRGDAILSLVRRRAPRRKRGLLRVVGL